MSDGHCLSFMQYLCNYYECYCTGAIPDMASLGQKRKLLGYVFMTILLTCSHSSKELFVSLEKRVLEEFQISETVQHLPEELLYFDLAKFVACQVVEAVDAVELAGEFRALVPFDGRPVSFVCDGGRLVPYCGDVPLRYRWLTSDPIG